MEPVIRTAIPDDAKPVTSVINSVILEGRYTALTNPFTEDEERAFIGWGIGDPTTMRIFFNAVLVSSNRIFFILKQEIGSEDLMVWLREKMLFFYSLYYILQSADVDRVRLNGHLKLYSVVRC